MAIKRVEEYLQNTRKNYGQQDSFASEYQDYLNSRRESAKGTNSQKNAAYWKDDNGYDDVMNDNVRYLLNKRYNTYHFGNKKKIKDESEYSFFGDDLTSKSRTDLTDLAREYASKRTTGRTTNEADAWREDREKANAGQQADMDSGKSLYRNLSSYTTGRNENTVAAPYAAVMQNTDYFNKIQSANEKAREKNRKLEEAEKELSKTGFIAPPYANPINYNDIESMPDYDEMVEKAKEIKENKVENAYKKMGEIGINKAGISPEKIVQMTNGVGGNKYVQDLRGYALLTDEERNRYDYILARSGERAAESYLSALQNEINERGALRQYENTQNMPQALQKPVNIGKSFLSGTENAFQGIKSLPDLFTGNAGNYDVSESEYYQDLLNNNSDGIENLGYKVSAGIGNMAPSIIAGALSGGVGASAGIGGKIASLASRGALQEGLFATQTAGQTYRQDIMEGRPVEGAQLNAILTGADEAATNWLLNGVAQFGGGAAKRALGDTKVLQAAKKGIANALSKNPVLLNTVNGAIGYGSDMLSEGTQEAVQDLTESIRKSFIYGDKLDLIGDLKNPQTWEDFAVGAMTAGVMNAPTVIQNRMDINDYGKSINHDYRDFSENIDIDENNYNSYQDFVRGQELQKTAAAYAERQKNGGFISNYEKAMYEKSMDDFMSDLSEHNGEYVASNHQEVQKEPQKADEIINPINQNIEKSVPSAINANGNKQKQTVYSGSPTFNNFESLGPWAEVYGKNGQEAFKTAYKSDTDIETYYRAFSRYYNAGRYNMDIQDADKTALAAMVTPEQAAEAYKAGAKDRNMEIGYDPVTGQIRNMVKGEAKTGGLESAAEAATKEQKQVAEGFGKRTGLKFILFDDMENGAVASYEPGKVRISVNSKNFNASISHELTHFIQDYSPDLYQAYQDTAVKALTEANSVSLDDLMESYAKNYEKAGQNLNNAQVTDEIVADATERFLNDPDYVDKIAKENRTLGEKILDFITDMIDSLKSLMKSGSTRKAAKGLEENISHYEVARNVWMAALEEAGDRYKSGSENIKASSLLSTESNSKSDTESGINDTNIRYQLEEVDDYSDRFLELVHENDDLREANSLLQKQFELTSKDEMRQEDIRKSAKNILKEYNSSYNSSVLERNMTKLFEYIRSADQVDGKEVAEVASDIARSVLKQSQQTDSELTESYKDLRKQIKDTKIKISDQDKADLAAAGGYNAFRRHYFGKMKLGNEGISADVFYEELADQYPELFNREVTHPADRIMQIANVLDMTQAQVINPYHANMDEMSYIVGQELLNAYFDVRNVKPTFADKQALEIDRVKREYKVKLDKFKESRITQYEAIINEKNHDIRGIKDEHSRELIAQQQKFNKKLQDRRDSLRRSNAKKIILKETKAMQTWLINPTDAKHIPQELRGKVAEFLNSIDFSSQDDGRDIQTQRTKTWNEVQKMFQSIMEKEGMVDRDGKKYYIDIDPDLVGRIDGLIGKVDGISKLEDLDAYYMEELQKTVQSMKKAITEINAMKSNERYGKVSLIAEDVFRETEGIKKKTEYTGPAGATDKLMNYDMIDPLTMFEKVGPAFKTVYDSIREGLNKKTLKLKLAEDYIRDIMGENNVSKKDILEWSGKNAKAKEFTVRGGKIKLTVSQIMSLYELDKRNQARGHMYDREGGIKPTDRAEGPKIETSLPVKVSKADVKKITDTLTAEQKNMADGIQRFLGDQVAAWGNQASMEMYGYEKFTAKDYFPIAVDGNFISKKEEENLKKSTIRNMGITKSTVKNANNPIKVEDIFDVYTRQVDQMSSYNAYVVPLSDLHKLMNYKDMRGFNGSSIKQEIERAFGKAGNNYIDTLVEDINGETKIEKGFGDWLLSNMKAASVAGNIRVAVQQPTAIVRAITEISPKYLARGVATISEKGQWELICKYAPIAQWKDWGFYQMQTSRQMKDILFGTDNKLRSVTNKSMIFAEIGDKVAWNRLWKACEYECQDIHPNLEVGSEEYYRQVGKRFSDIVDRTQVVDSVLHRTQIMRSENGFAKFSTSFMGEPLKSYNMLYRAGIYVRRKRKGAKLYAGKAASAFVANAFFTSLASAIVDATRDEDREKGWRKKYWKYVEQNLGDNLNPINFIPYGKDVMSVAAGYTPVRGDMSGVQDIYYAAKKLWKLYKGESEYTTKYLVMNMAQSFSKIFGIPLKSIIRDSVSIADTAYHAAGGEYDYEWLKQKYEIGSDDNRKKYAELMLYTAEMGNQKLADKIKADMMKAGQPEDKIYDSLNKITGDRIDSQVDILGSVIDYDKENKDSQKAFEFEVSEYIRLKSYAGWDEKRSLDAIRDIITKHYKPLWKAEKDSTKRGEYIEKCNSLFYKGDSIYAGYDFKKNWKDDKEKQ